MGRGYGGQNGSLVQHELHAGTKNYPDISAEAFAASTGKPTVQLTEWCGLPAERPLGPCEV